MSISSGVTLPMLFLYSTARSISMNKFENAEEHCESLNVNVLASLALSKYHPSLSSSSLTSETEVGILSSAVDVSFILDMKVVLGTSILEASGF